MESVSIECVTVIDDLLTSRIVTDSSLQDIWSLQNRFQKHNDWQIHEDGHSCHGESVLSAQCEKGK